MPLLHAVIAAALAILRRWRGRYGRHSERRHHGRHLRKADDDDDDRPGAALGR